MPSVFSGKSGSHGASPAWESSASPATPRCSKNMRRWATRSTMILMRRITTSFVLWKPMWKKGPFFTSTSSIVTNRLRSIWNIFGRDLAGRSLRKLRSHHSWPCPSIFPPPSRRKSSQSTRCIQCATSSGPAMGQSSSPPWSHTSPSTDRWAPRTPSSETLRA